MNLVKNKIFVGFAACIIFFSVSFFLFQINVSNGPRDYIVLTGAHLIFFNFAILSGWLSMGWAGGAVFLALSILGALTLSAVAGARLYYVYIACFVFTAFLCYRYLQEFVAFRTEHELKREKVEEEANTLAERLEKDRAQAEASRIKLERYEKLKSVAEHLSDIFSLDKISEFLTAKSLEIVGKSTRSLVYLVDAESQELVLTHALQPQDLPRIKMKKGDIFDKWVLRQNQPLIVLDVTKDFRFSRNAFDPDELVFKSLIAVPMISDNKMVGLLRLDSPRPDAYNPDDLRLLDIIADLGAVALQNSVLYERMNELAIRDGLTQLFVHRYFMERLTLEIQRALNKDHMFCVMIIDIDHFKKYNDRYGHIAGDILLKHLAGIFTSIVHKGDIVARYGGEEFVVLVFGEGARGARRIAEKIRKAVEDERFYLRRETTHATVSIGIAVFPDDAKTRDDLFRVADANLYSAKKDGRNKVCLR